MEPEETADRMATCHSMSLSSFSYSTFPFYLNILRTTKPTLSSCCYDKIPCKATLWRKRVLWIKVPCYTPSKRRSYSVMSFQTLNTSIIRNRIINPWMVVVSLVSTLTQFRVLCFGNCVSHSGCALPHQLRQSRQITNIDTGVYAV